VADLIAKGLGSLPASAMVAMAIAAIVALVFEVLRIRSRGRFPLSAVSIGLGVVLPPESTLAMWIGAFVFWWMGRKAVAGTPQHDLWVEGCDLGCGPHRHRQRPGQRLPSLSLGFGSVGCWRRVLLSQ
jgi:uncharacterized oligopeptide transporter (OPT) family protein